MKYIKKVSTVKIDKTTGSVVDTTNITDKVTNAYSARVVEELIKNNTPEIDIPEVPTKTSQLTNDSGFITASNGAITNKTYYTDFEVSQHGIYVSGISSGASNFFSANITKSGYYPLCLACTGSINHNNAGFTINPIRLSARSAGSATVYYWGRNDASHKSDCTGYIDILWVKIK